MKPTRIFCYAMDDLDRKDNVLNIQIDQTIQALQAKLYVDTSVY